MLAVTLTEAVGDFLVRPIPNSSGGGRRPVASVRAAVRVRGRVRQCVLRQWQAQCVKDAALNRRKGRHTRDAVYRDAVRSIIDDVRGQVVVEALLDVEAFFDSIAPSDMVRQTGLVNYPVVLLRLSLSA